MTTEFFWVFELFDDAPAATPTESATPFIDTSTPISQMFGG